MTENPQSEFIRRVMAAIDRGDTLHGLITLEGAGAIRSVPVVSSYLAYCISKERGQHREALRMVQAAMAAEPHNPAHYLNLGRIYLVTGHKAKAIETFRKGLSTDPAADKNVYAESPADTQAKQQALILAELRRLGIRRRATFPSLPREHPLNKVAGKLLARLRLR